MSNNEIFSAEYSFWEFIKADNIEIPLIQRDYAYGRDESKREVNNNKKDSEEELVELIRNGMITDMVNSLISGKRLNLNFIYGTEADSQFTPLDGQQRLTTLFLLHWYVFQRSNSLQDLKQLKRFSYATRETTRTFCKKICDIDGLDFDLELLSNQIQEYSWFADAYLNDPSIWSMLVVIDSIHKTISRCIADSDIDFVVMRDCLIGNDCPIIAQIFCMTGVKNDEDLYIKGNGRGKQLVNFEIFKSSLQNSPKLERVIGSPTLEDRVDYISSFNNEYSEMFFKLFNSDVSKVETALFAFIRDFFRDMYFVIASEEEIPEKDYRDRCKAFSEVNGKVLSSFFQEDDYYKFYAGNNKNVPEDLNVHILRSVSDLLQKMYVYWTDNGNTLCPGKSTFSDEDYFNEDDRIRSIVDSTRDISDYLIDYALLLMVARFDFPKTQDEKDAWVMWKRYVKNIASNINLKGSYESLVKIMRVFKDLCAKIDEYSLPSILETIKSANNHSLLSKSDLLKPQFDEEAIKAELMLKPGENWLENILKVEDYFSQRRSKTGNIRFALFFSCSTQSQYDNQRFVEYFERIQRVLDEKMHVRNDVDHVKLEQALLCLPDSTSECGHLTKLDYWYTYKFCGNDYSSLLCLERDLQLNEKQKQWTIFKEYLTRLKDGTSVDSVSEEIINERSNLPLWKEYFVESNRFSRQMGDRFFNNTIYKNGNIILLLNLKTIQSKSMELNTLRLYDSLVEGGKTNIELHFFSNSELYDQTMFPNRFFSIGNVQVGYDVDSELYVIRTPGENDYKCDYDQALRKLF